MLTLTLLIPMEMVMVYLIFHRTAYTDPIAMLILNTGKVSDTALNAWYMQFFLLLHNIKKRG